MVTLEKIHLGDCYGYYDEWGNRHLMFSQKEIDHFIRMRNWAIVLLGK